ncbi:MAG: histidinol-phosphate transaminase [Bryobacteraceae bacterium]|nr:histidinol-phosphate transaminase [Bryobacteraceae bacterium]
MIAPRPAVLKMAPYHPPSGGRAGKLRLDFNENTVGCSPRVAEYLREVLTQPLLAVYPEYEDTRPALATFFGISPDELLLSNGTDEAIQVLINTYVDDGDEVLTLTPSYAMYRFYAELAGAQVREVPYEADTLAFPVARFLAQIRPSTKAILVANPNNPTGCGVSLAVVEQVLQAAPRAAVLIDEAYYEFCGRTALPLLNKYPNLFVSRTFSKAYGMAAMRMGCLMSNAANMAHLRKAQSPYSVNLLAALAARVAVADTEYVSTYVAEAVASRETLYRFFDEMKIGYWRSEANFVLFRAGERAVPIRDELRRRGVLVRDRSYELPGAVRVTVGRAEQTERFMQELREIW